MANSNDAADGPVPSKQDYALEAVLMLCAIVPVIVSFYASLVTGEGHWFQRSGALMVLFSFAVEFHRTRVFGRATQCGEDQCEVDGAAMPALARFWRSVPYACYASILLGTMIWSYGDLLFR